MGTLGGLGGLAMGEYLLRGTGFAPDNTLLFVGSFGALSTLLYAAPAAPLGTPKNTIYGHTVSIGIALAVHHIAMAASAYGGWALPMAVEKVLTPALAIGAMVYLKIPHPPAAACVVVYATLADGAQQMPTYLLMPALVGCAYMLAVQRVVAVIVHRAAANAAPVASNGDAKPASTKEVRTPSLSVPHLERHI